MRLLCRPNRRLKADFPAQQLHSLLVAQRAKRPSRLPILLQQPPSLFHQTVLKHPAGPLVDARVERIPIRIQPDPQDAKARERLPPLLPHLGHLPARRQANFDRPDQLWRVISMDFPRSLRIQTPQDPVQINRPPSLHCVPQSSAQFLRPLRTRKQPLQQRAQVKAGPANNNRQVAASLNVIQNLSSLARILPGRHIGVGRNEVEQMMRDARSFFRARLGRADLELPVHRHRIAVDDLSLKPFREFERKRSLAAGGGTQNRNQQRITRQRKLQCSAYQ